MKNSKADKTEKAVHLTFCESQAGWIETKIYIGTAYQTVKHQRQKKILRWIKKGTLLSQ